MENKIQVLLIDDLPTFALTNVKRTQLKNIKPYQKDKRVPYISDSTYCDFFELKWLRNKEDLLLYKKLCRDIEDTFSSSELGNNNIPEIVLFDYALTGHEDTNFLNEENDLNLLEQINPNYKLTQLWKEKNSSGNLPKIDEININANQIYSGLNDDNIGCIGGIMTVTHFRNHLCVGIATSRKTNIDIQGNDVQFLEHLVKEPNQFNFQLRGNISNLNWKVLLNKSVKLLKFRIETQIQTGKATPNYSQLTSIAQGNFFREGTFSIETAYGKRDLPLLGLFIDIDDDEQIKPEIQDWANRLLNKLPITNSITKKAIEVSMTLWDTYIYDFEDRIILSDYSTRLSDLNPIEIAYLYEVKMRLGVNSKTGLISSECSIQSLLDGEDRNVIRLSILILVTRASIELEKQRVESNFNEKYSQLKPDEYFNLLYPKANLGKEKKKTIILPMNFVSKTEKEKVLDSHKKWLMRNLTIIESEVKQADIFHFENWILKSEKDFLKSYFYGESKYYPQWLK